MNATNTTSAIGTTLSLDANGLLIAISFFVAALGAYTCFQFMQEIRYIKNKLIKLFCIFLASISISLCSIWAMHFIGTVCFSMYYVRDGARVYVPANYDIGLTVASAVAAWFMCFLALLFSSIQIFFPVIRKLAILNILSTYRFGAKHLRASSTRSSTSSAGTEKEKKSILKKFTPTKYTLVSAIEGDKFKPHIIQVLISAVLVAGGVCVMHYVGMLATKVMASHMIFNAGVIVASCIIALVAGAAAVWVAFNIPTGPLQALFAVIAGVAVCAMHYTGMAAATHMVVSDSTALDGPQFSSLDLSLVVVIAASGICFLMLVISSVISGKRTDMAVLNQKLSKEKERNRILLLNLSNNLTNLNDLVNRIAMEEFQTRRVLDVVNDAVVIVDFEGTIIKTNNAFVTLASLKEREITNMSDCFECLDISDIIEAKESVTNCKFKSPFHGSIPCTVHATIEDSMEAKFCVLVINKIGVDIRRKTPVAPLSDLDELFNNKQELEKFSSFCTKEACAESILFLQKVSEFENAPLVQRLKIQEQILNTFLVKDAEHELNLPAKDIQQIVKEINSGLCQTDLFRPLVGVVRQELVSNFIRYKEQSSPALTVVVSSK